jgi:ubiquitin C-terminal hydrolase
MGFPPLDKDIQYRIRGSALHHGGGHGGHYTAICFGEDPATVVHIDDTTLTTISSMEEAVTATQWSYFLVYDLIDLQ